MFSEFLRCIFACLLFRILRDMFTKVGSGGKVQVVFVFACFVKVMSVRAGV